MTFDQSRQRADILGTQVITRTDGKRLGVVSQMWVDIDRGEVVALGVRENVLSGVLSGNQQIMQLSSIRQIGDVILVDDDTALEDDELSVSPYSTLVNCQVITENGDMLGRVRGFRFNVTDGKLQSLVIASLGLPQIPDQVISTYELPIEEIVSSGPDRLIVFEGAEEKMVRLTTGIMERLGIGAPPWERGEEDAYIMPVSTSNQLPSGVEAPVEPLRSRTPIRQEQPLEQDWREPEPLYTQAPAAPPQRAELAYDPEETDNWGDDGDDNAYAADYREVTEDVWTESEPEEQPYEAPPVNIPQKKKVTEYEEELDY
jgi:sporulation protein YlmC with PRC-barrel domain